MFRLRVVLPLIAWTILVLFALQFRGAHVGGPACWDNPYCDDPIAWNEIIVWTIGATVILLLGLVTRSNAR